MWSNNNYIYRQVCCVATGADVSRIRKEDAGLVLSDTVKRYMYEMKMDNGLKAVGYTTDDIKDLVKGTLPQVTLLQPIISVGLGFHPSIAPWPRAWRCAMFPHFLTGWVSRLLELALVSWVFARVDVPSAFPYLGVFPFTLLHLPLNFIRVSSL